MKEKLKENIPADSRSTGASWDRSCKKWITVSSWSSHGFQNIFQAYMMSMSIYQYKYIHIYMYISKYRESRQKKVILLMEHLQESRVFTAKSWKDCFVLLLTSTNSWKIRYGGFLKQGYPKIIHVHVLFFMINHPFGGTGTPIHGNPNMGMCEL